MIGTTTIVVMTRVVLAPRAHVFAAWQRPERMARWWSHEHPGGRAEPCGDGSYRVGHVVVAVRDERPPEYLVFTWGSGDHETKTLVTVTFADHGSETRLSIRQTTDNHLGRLAVLLRANALSA